MEKFTIKDLMEGRCAVKNDGSLRDLIKVLTLAFPDDVQPKGLRSFYFRSRISSERWNSSDTVNIPSQSVKLFLETAFPKRGDRILVSNDNGKWVERTFITFIEGELYPVVCVDISHECSFKHGNKFLTYNWCYWKPIEEKTE